MLELGGMLDFMTVPESWAIGPTAKSIATAESTTVTVPTGDTEIEPLTMPICTTEAV
jgi:hypothetical protein